ncbi:MAG: DNA primase [Alphaproteobacteria bacterium]
MSLKQFFSDVDGRISLASIIEKDMKLTKRGREYVGLCPFHHEKTPSFTVIEDKKFFHCFGCGKSGRAIDWLVEKRGLSFKEGLLTLSQLSGVALPNYKKTSASEQKGYERENEVYPLIMANVKQYYQDHLYSQAGKHALNYLQDRGLKQPTIQHFGLGYSPDEFDINNLLQYLTTKLKQHHISEQDLIKLGLVRTTHDHRQKKFLLFRGRVMFPIEQRHGNIIGFGGRFMGDASKHNTGKYINSPDSALFSKGSHLYNFNHALQAIKNIKSKKPPLLVVEGYMDVIGLTKAGFLSAVAPLGTALTEQQLQLLWRMTNIPIIGFDGDQAGMMAAFRAARRALPHLSSNQTLEFAFMPNGDDPDSLVRRLGVGSLMAVLSKKIPLHEFLWQWESAQADITRPEGILGLKQNLMSYARTIANPSLAKLYQDFFYDKIYQTKNTHRPSPTRYRPKPDGYNRFSPKPPIAEKMVALPKMDDLTLLPPRAILAIISLYPMIYQEWQNQGLESGFYDKLQEKNTKKSIKKHLDNYLKKLHIIMKALPEKDKPNYKTPNPEDVLLQWQNQLKNLFLQDNNDSLWYEVFDKKLGMFYQQIFAGDEGDVQYLMNELIELEAIGTLKKDFQHILYQSPANTAEQKKIESFQKEIEKMENSLHQRSLKTDH